MDFKKLLDRAYDEKTKGLYQRKKKIEDRLGEFDPQEGEGLKAKIEVLERKSREAFGDGKDEAVVGYEEEIQKIRDKLQAQSEEISALNAESDQIQRQIDQAAAQTLSQIYPKIRDCCHGEWAKALDTTEGAWTALQEFEIKQGAKLSVTIHRNGLTPQSMGTDKELRKKFEQWIF